jgi:hypothetical protein
MMNDHEESHVVLQAWRFRLNEKDEVSSNQPPTKVAKKEI